MPLIDIPEFYTEKPSEAQLAEWEAALWETGYLIIPNVLPPAAVEHFYQRGMALPESWPYGRSIARVFEQGMDFVHLLENEPIFSLMERVLGSNMHIISEQVHRMRPGNEVIGWHPDELYLFRAPGAPDTDDLPPIINAINVHYYLVDVPEELGPTMIVPGSHRASRAPRPEDGDPPQWRGQQPIKAVLKAGDCVLYSNACWHTGSPILNGGTRLSVVPTYARRFVAQRFWPFLNYNLSRDILDRCTPRQRQLLGEQARGAYG